MASTPPTTEAATIRDVARAARCSTATVSRVLNHFPHVSRPTRERVFAAMRALRFTPLKTYAAPSGKGAQPAGGLLEFVLCNTRMTESIVGIDPDGAIRPSAPHGWTGGGFTTPGDHLSNAFYFGLFTGVTAEAARLGRKTIYHDLLSLAGDATLTAPSGPPLVLAGIYHDDLPPLVRHCARPLVLLDLLMPGVDASVVTTDNLGGVRMALEHLFEFGHRRVGFIGDSKTDPAYTERHAAYLATLISSGRPVRAEWQCLDLYLMADIEMAVTPMLRAADRPTAFVACNDWIALAVLRAAHRAGLDVPRDLSIVGFDDTEIAAMARPALTSVHVDTRALGRLAARLLIQPGEAGEYIQIRVPPRLIARDSTGPAPKDGHA